MQSCLLVTIGVLTPRILMVFILLLTDWFSKAYESTIWPVLGFLFMPYTTLAYLASMINNNHQLTGGWIVLIIVAVLFDLAANTKTRYNNE